MGNPPVSVKYELEQLSDDWDFESQDFMYYENGVYDHDFLLDLKEVEIKGIFIILKKMIYSDRLL